MKINETNNSKLAKTAYNKPLIIQLSTDAGTQGMGMNAFGGTKMTQAAESFLTMSPS